MVKIEVLFSFESNWLKKIRHVQAEWPAGGQPSATFPKTSTKSATQQQVLTSSLRSGDPPPETPSAAFFSSKRSEHITTIERKTTFRGEGSARWTSGGSGKNKVSVCAQGFFHTQGLKNKQILSISPSEYLDKEISQQSQSRDKLFVPLSSPDDISCAHR